MIRVSAGIIRRADGRILICRRGPGRHNAHLWEFPGGKQEAGETPSDCLARELREELGIEAAIIRPLWLCQSFFTEDVKQEKFHELCLYFLMDASETGLFDRGEQFTLQEGKHTHRFEWLPLERLKDEYRYPNFIKESVFHLPDQLTLIHDYE